MDPSSPEMTLLLVMLHTGTMFAVIVYFWRRWHRAFLQSAEAFKRSVFLLFLATVLTGVVGEALIKIIEKVLLRGGPNAESSSCSATWKSSRLRWPLQGF